MFFLVGFEYVCNRLFVIWGSSYGVFCFSYISRESYIYYWCHLFFQWVYNLTWSKVSYILEMSFEKCTFWKLKLQPASLIFRKIILRHSGWTFSLESCTNTLSIWKKQKSLNWSNTFCINAVKYVGPCNSPKGILRNLYLLNMVVEALLSLASGWNFIW